MAVLSPCKAWAVGDARSGQTQSALVEHWNGSAWTVVSTPSPGSGDSELLSVTSVSRSDAWAVGLFGVRPLIEHWNGKTWSLVPSPDFGRRGAQLRSVSAVSARDVWAVGSVGSKNNDGTDQTLIEHWTGSGWKVVPSPDPGHDNFLGAVSASPRGGVWAVGRFSITSDQDQPLILRWNGRRWVRVGSPVGVGTVLSAVTAISASDAWAAGFGTLILHWKGTSWAQVTSPDLAESELFAVAASPDSATVSNIWAVGDFDASPLVPQILALHCC